MSWAVPKGPTLDSAQRRMAIHVEDHPIEYFDFEGVIPSRQYGAGDVIVWDWGTWEPEAPTDDARTAIPDGELKFLLDGEKLKGRFTIVRTSGRRRKGDDPAARAFEDDGGEQWLLIHKRGPDDQPGWDAEDHPQSVKTGRTNDDVKADRDALWNGEAPAAQAEIDLTGAVEAPMPSSIEPMLATLAIDAVRRPGLAVRDQVGRLSRPGGRRRREGPDVDPQPQGRRDVLPAPALAGQLDRRPGGDRRRRGRGPRRRRAPGLLAPPDELGQPGAGGLVYQAFDLLYLDGRSLLNVPLEDRKRLLRSVLRDHPRVRFAAHVEGEGKAFYEAARRTGSRASSPSSGAPATSRAGARNAWLKLKIRPEQELVVGGWTPGEGNARDLGALAVGVYEDGKLRFAGKVGSGFTGAMRKDLLARLQPLVVEEPPFDPPPPKDYQGRWGGDLGAVTWVRPELVIRAELGGWTRDGMVRQAAFKGLEAGRDPTTVRRESAVATTSAVRAAEAETPATADVGDDAAMPRTARTAKTAKAGSTARPARPPRPRSTARRPTAKAASRPRPPSPRFPMRGASPTPSWPPSTRSARKALAGRRRRAQADQPRQAAVRGRSADHQARAHPLLRADRTDDAAATSPTGRSTCSGSRTAPARRASGRRTSRRPRRRG